jgi:itaconate CoA-transferase
VLIAIQNEREWAQFCARFLGEPDLPARAGFRSNVERVENRATVDAHIAGSVCRRTRSACAEDLGAAGTAFGFVNNVSALTHHPALRRITLDTPEGPVSIAAPAAQFIDADRECGPVPALGQDTERIRAEFAS